MELQETDEQDLSEAYVLKEVTRGRTSNSLLAKREFFMGFTEKSTRP